MALLPHDIKPLPEPVLTYHHYNDVIMGAMASQITSLTIVYSTVYLGADQRKYQSSASLAFVRGIHRWPVNSPHKWPVTWKCFHLMMSSWSVEFSVFLSSIWRVVLNTVLTLVKWTRLYILITALYIYFVLPCGVINYWLMLSVLHVQH